jgi:hypothetical protein
LQSDARTSKAHNHASIQTGKEEAKYIKIYVSKKMKIKIYIRYWKQRAIDQSL